MSLTSSMNARTWLGAALAAFVAVLLRWGAMQALPDSLLHKPSDDPDAYVLIAHQLRASGTYAREAGVPTAYRPPAYPLAIALWCGSEVPNVRGIALLHLVAGGLTAAFTVLWASSLKLGRWAWLAGFLVAIDPLLLRQSTLIMSETLFTTFFIGAIYFLSIGTDQHRSKGWLILSGTLWGLAALTRPIAGVVILSISLGALLSGKTKEWLITAFIAFITILPWGIRNEFVLGRLLLTTTHGGYTLWLGQNPTFYREVVTGENIVWSKESFDEWTESNRSATQGMNEIEQDAYFRKEATHWMMDHPREAANSILYHVRSLWGVSPRTDSKGFGLLVTTYYVALILAIIIVGVRFLPRLFVWPGWIMTLAILSFTVVHAIYWSDMRMRAPLVPLLAVLVAGGCSMLGRQTKGADDSQTGKVLL